MITQENVATKTIIVLYFPTHIIIKDTYNKRA